MPITTRRIFAVAALAVALIHCGSSENIELSTEKLGSVKQKVTMPVNAPPSLKTVTVPRPSNLSDFIADEAAAVRLGKALFWEMQVGSDGATACASCHFHAGSDNRTRNQMSPGLLHAHEDGTSNPETTFETPAPNHRFVTSDFPFHQLSDPDNRDSTVLFDTNDVAGSQGVFSMKYQSLLLGLPIDLVVTTPDADGFRVGSTNVRRVEPRNTPTIINAVFNHRQFWDGRAQPEFNGVNIWGARDPNAFLYKRASNGHLVKTTVSIPNASLASQALGPPLSSFEMSADGQTFQEIGDNFVGSILDKALSPALGLKLLRATGKKLVAGGLRPLDKQHVAADDSVLGSLSRSPSTGLSTTYEAMIQAAFKPEWWNGNQYVRIENDGSRTVKNPGLGGLLGALLGANDYTQMEYNFSLFFGLAIQMYESTLVADDTPFDKFRDGDPNAISETAQEGVVLFSDTVRVRCINCHGGAELTDAAVARVTSFPLRRREGNILDRGFNNIGVRPTFEDLGVGNVDAVTGKPLAYSRLAELGEFTDPALVPPLAPEDIVGVDGAFKMPGLRNVALTGPYFHNGGQVSLRQVIEFYSRGGDFQPIEGREGEISPLGTPNLTESEKEAVEAFLRSLTDERVTYERAPFDHPEIMVPDGHPGSETSVTNRGDGNATDAMLTIPAVGRYGGSALTSFLGQ